MQLLNPFMACSSLGRGAVANPTAADGLMGCQIFFQLSTSRNESFSLEAMQTSLQILKHVSVGCWYLQAENF